MICMMLWVTQVSVGESRQKHKWRMDGFDMQVFSTAFFCSHSDRNTFALQKCVCWKLSRLLSPLLDLFSLQNEGLHDAISYLIPHFQVDAGEDEVLESMF